MSNIGILEAPDVTIKLNQELENNKTTIGHIIKTITLINNSIQIKPITISNPSGLKSTSRINNHVQFTDKNKEKKEIFVTTSEAGGRGYTPNDNWDGEALFFLKTEEGPIKIGSDHYKVYKFNSKEYESLKNEKQSGSANFQEKWKHNELQQDGFVKYFE